MKFIIFSIMLAFSLVASELNWSDDYEASLKVAQKQDKDLYVLITSSTCRWCRKFEATTLQDKEVLRMLNEKYILVNLDKDIDDIPDWMIVKTVPRHYFVTQKDKQIFTFLGYWDELDFRSFLGDVEEERANKVKKGEIK